MLRDYLKELRKTNNMTQADVATAIGIGSSTYTMIESGERQKDMNISLAQKLADVFEVPIEFILENERK